MPRMQRVDVAKKYENPLQNLVMQSQVLAGVISTKPSQLMLGRGFPSTLLDEVSHVAKNDHLIVALGESWLRRSTDNREKGK